MNEEWLKEAERLLRLYARACYLSRSHKEMDDTRAAVLAHLAQRGTSLDPDVALGMSPAEMVEHDQQIASGVQAMWDDLHATQVAHAAGFAGKSWVMGPEELAHVLNTAATEGGQSNG